MNNKSPLGYGIPEVKEILYPPWRNQQEWLWNIDQVVGYFAMWAIRQSPYDVPKRIYEACDELTSLLKSAVKDLLVNDLLWFKCTHDKVEEILLKIFEDSTTIMDWNTAYNARHRPGLYTKRYEDCGDNSSNMHPDNDFIDLHALARNISHSLIAETLLNDTPVQPEKEKVENE